MKSAVKNLQESYSLFERLMHERKIYLEESIDFLAICRLLNVDSKSFDDLIHNETGYWGNELISLYRTQESEKNCEE